MRVVLIEDDPTISVPLADGLMRSGFDVVAENDGTRANINVGESVFTAEWEAGDALGILPVKTGGTAPAVLAFLVTTTGNNATPGIYVAGASLISLVAVVVLRESAGKPLPGSGVTTMKEKVAS